MVSPQRRSRGRTPPAKEKNKVDPSAKDSTSGDKSPPRKKSPSPVPVRRPRTGSSRSRHPREVIVERVVRESGSSGNWPQLTKTNYDSWSLLMKIKLQTRALWDAVDLRDAEYHDDRTALEAICSAVPQEMVPTLATKASAKEAWDAIKSMRVGDDRVRKSTAQALRAEYEQITFLEGESVEDFSLRLTNIVQHLAILGDPEPEAKVVAKYLRVARPRYKQLAVSIVTLLDISTLSIEEVTGRLRSAATDEPAPAPTVGGKLLLTEEQWLERYKQKDQESGRGGSNSGGRGKRRGKPRPRGGGGNTSGGRSGTNSGRATTGDICKRCGKTGHWA
ncbi:unnamed protein product [Urochloa humidicola]